MLTKLKNGLDGTQLKTIALALMVLDHIHYFFEFTGCIPTVFSMLGRLSAPLFLFCTVEGFAHTHDRRRYFVRIWGIGTAMAALEFFMIYAKAFRRGDGFYPLNAIFQDLMLLCIVWQGIDWLREKKWVRGVAAIAAVEACFRDLGLPVSLGQSEAGVIPEEELEALALGCSRGRSRSVGSFCPLDHDGLLAVYRAANH